MNKQINRIVVKVINENRMGFLTQFLFGRNFAKILSIIRGFHSIYILWTKFDLIACRAGKWMFKLCPSNTLFLFFWEDCDPGKFSWKGSTSTINEHQPYHQFIESETGYWIINQFVCDFFPTCTLREMISIIDAPDQRYDVTWIILAPGTVWSSLCVATKTACLELVLLQAVSNHYRTNSGI